MEGEQAMRRRSWRESGKVVVVVGSRRDFRQQRERLGEGEKYRETFDGKEEYVQVRRAREEKGEWRFV